jgi:hypothetical protein
LGFRFARIGGRPLDACCSGIVKQQRLCGGAASVVLLQGGSLGLSAGMQPEQ